MFTLWKKKRIYSTKYLYRIYNFYVLKNAYWRIQYT